MTMETFIVAMLGSAPALIAILIAQKQFITQRWWEKKADEYIRVINELANYQSALYKAIDTETTLDNIDSILTDRQKIENIKEEEKTIRESVRKTSMAGSILINDEAGEALTKLLHTTHEIKLFEISDISFDELVKEKNILTESYNEIKNFEKAVGETIRKIRKCAKKDLGLSKQCWVCKLRSCGLCFPILRIGNRR